MGNICGYIGQLGISVLNTPEHSVERSHGRFQLNRYFLRVQAHVQSGRRDRADLFVGSTDRHVPPTNRDPGHQDGNAHEDADGPPLDTLETLDEYEMATNIHGNGDRVPLAKAGVATDLYDGTAIVCPVFRPYRHFRCACEIDRNRKSTR